MPSQSAHCLHRTPRSQMRGHTFHPCLTLRENAAKAGNWGAGWGQALCPRGLCDAGLSPWSFQGLVSSGELLVTVAVCSPVGTEWSKPESGSGTWQVLTHGSPPLLLSRALLDTSNDSTHTLLPLAWTILFTYVRCNRIYRGKWVVVVVMFCFIYLLFFFFTIGES